MRDTLNKLGLGLPAASAALNAGCGLGIILGASAHYLRIYLVGCAFGLAVSIGLSMVALIQWTHRGAGSHAGYRIAAILGPLASGFQIAMVFVVVVYLALRYGE